MDWTSVKKRFLVSTFYIALAASVKAQQLDNVITIVVLVYLLLVLFQLDIDGFSVHKMFRHKAQQADNGYSLGKCCNAVTGHLVIALRVSFSAPLEVLCIRPLDKGMTIASETCLASNTEKLTAPVNIKLKEY